jgi:copper(I)-binding protein
VFRRRLLAGAIVLLVPALAGCEAGLNAPTLEFHPAAAGATTVANEISINNVFVLGPPSGSTLPAGSSAGLFLGLYNNGDNGDALVSASSNAARSVTITGSPVSLPPQTSVNLTGPEPELVLSGLTAPLQGGEDVDVTLNFQTAGPVTIDVPVQPQSFYYSTYSQAAAPTPTVPPTPSATTPTPTSTTPSPKSTKAPATPTATPTR